MNLIRILIKACIFMIFIIPKFNVVVQHSTLVNRLPSSTSILTSTVFSIPCWSPASHQHSTSIPPAFHAGHQHPTSIPRWSPASHQHPMLVTSIPAPKHNICWSMLVFPAGCLPQKTATLNARLMTSSTCFDHLLLVSPRGEATRWRAKHM